MIILMLTQISLRTFRQIKIYTGIIVFFLLYSCITEVDVSFAEPEMEISLNCILRPEMDTVLVWLSYTRPLLSSNKFEPVEDARLVLYEGEEPAGQFQQADSTAWILPYKVKPGVKYKLEVTGENSTVWAETWVPQLISAEIDSLQLYNYRLDYKISFQDNPYENNYYWITAKGYSWFDGLPSYEIAGSLLTDYHFADDFNRYIESFGGYTYSYEIYMRIADGSLPDKIIQLQFHPTTIDLSQGPQEVIILSVDYHLDKYMKSSLLNRETDLYAEDVPIVYAPFPVYSNIKGGSGIFGSYSSISKIFSGNP